MRILYVSGSPQFALSNKVLLNKIQPGHGHEIVLKETASEAIQLLEQEPFDLVVSSIKYPVIPNAEKTHRPLTGGIHLYNYILNKKAKASAGHAPAFCFHVQCEGHVAQAFLVEKKFTVTPEKPLIFGPETRLHEIVYFFARQSCAVQPAAPHQPAKKKATGEISVAVKEGNHL